MDWKEYPEEQKGETPKPQEPPTMPPGEFGQNGGSVWPGYTPQAPSYYPPATGNGAGVPPYQAPYGTTSYPTGGGYLQGQPVTTAYYTGPTNVPLQPTAPSPPSTPYRVDAPQGTSGYGPQSGGGYGQPTQPGVPSGGGFYGQAQPGQQPGYPRGGPSGCQSPYQPYQPAYPPQPGTSPYGQPPRYGAPPLQPQPGYAPPVDTTRPLCVTASRRVTFQQYKRLNGLGTGPLTVTLVVVLILTLLLGAITIFLAYPYEVEGFILTIALTAVSEAVGIILAARLAIRRNRALREAYACAEAAGTGEAVLELYHDRVQAVTMRGSSVVPLASAVLWEMSDMLALVGPGATIVWRGEDLTPEEGRTIYHLLMQRVPPSCRRTKEPFVPGAPFPLPLPVIRNDDEVKAVVRTHRPTPSIGGAIGTGLGRMLPMLTPLLTILGAYLAANYAITVSFTADIGLFALICWGSGLLLAVGVLALLALARRDKGPAGAPEAAYAFTRDGMARRVAGGTVFVPHAFIRKRLRSDGVELKTPYGREFIRWTEVPDPAALQAALGLDGPAGKDKQ